MLGIGDTSTNRSRSPGKASGVSPMARAAKAAMKKRFASMGAPVLFFLFLAGVLPQSSMNEQMASRFVPIKAPAQKILDNFNHKDSEA